MDVSFIKQNLVQAVQAVHATLDASARSAAQSGIEQFKEQASSETILTVAFELTLSDEVSDPVLLFGLHLFDHVCSTRWDSLDADAKRYLQTSALSLIKRASLPSVVLGRPVPLYFKEKASQIFSRTAFLQDSLQWQVFWGALAAEVGTGSVSREVFLLVALECAQFVLEKTDTSTHFPDDDEDRRSLFNSWLATMPQLIRTMAGYLSEAHYAFFVQGEWAHSSSFELNASYRIILSGCRAFSVLGENAPHVLLFESGLIDMLIMYMSPAASLGLAVSQSGTSPFLSIEELATETLLGVVGRKWNADELALAFLDKFTLFFTRLACSPVSMNRDVVVRVSRVFGDFLENQAFRGIWSASLDILRAFSDHASAIVVGHTIGAWMRFFREYQIVVSDQIQSILTFLFERLMFRMSEKRKTEEEVEDLEDAMKHTMVFRNRCIELVRSAAAGYPREAYVAVCSLWKNQVLQLSLPDVSSKVAYSSQITLYFDSASLIYESVAEGLVPDKVFLDEAVLEAKALQLVDCSQIALDFIRGILSLFTAPSPITAHIHLVGKLLHLFGHSFGFFKLIACVPPTIASTANFAELESSWLQLIPLIFDVCGRYMRYSLVPEKTLWFQLSEDERALRRKGASVILRLSRNISNLFEALCQYCRPQLPYVPDSSVDRKSKMQIVYSSMSTLKSFAGYLMQNLQGLVTTFQSGTSAATFDESFPFEELGFLYESVACISFVSSFPLQGSSLDFPFPSEEDSAPYQLLLFEELFAPFTTKCVDSIQLLLQQMGDDMTGYLSTVFAAGSSQSASVILRALRFLNAICRSIKYPLLYLPFFPLFAPVVRLLSVLSNTRSVDIVGLSQLEREVILGKSSKEEHIEDSTKSPKDWVARFCYISRDQCLWFVSHLAKATVFRIPHPAVMQHILQRFDGTVHLDFPNSMIRMFYAHPQTILFFSVTSRDLKLSPYHYLRLFFKHVGSSIVEYFPGKRLELCGPLDIQHLSETLYHVIVAGIKPMLESRVCADWKKKVDAGVSAYSLDTCAWSFDYLVQNSASASFSAAVSTSTGPNVKADVVLERSLRDSTCDAVDFLARVSALMESLAKTNSALVLDFLYGSRFCGFAILEMASALLWIPDSMVFKKCCLCISDILKILFGDHASVFLASQSASAYVELLAAVTSLRLLEAVPFGTPDVVSEALSSLRLIFSAFMVDHRANFGGRCDVALRQWYVSRFCPVYAVISSNPIASFSDTVWLDDLPSRLAMAVSASKQKTVLKSVFGSQSFNLLNVRALLLNRMKLHVSHSTAASGKKTRMAVDDSEKILRPKHSGEEDELAGFDLFAV
eukprot:ANDGO_07920.mRNA.1 hypothetical protein